MKCYVSIEVVKICKLLAEMDGAFLFRAERPACASLFIELVRPTLYMLMRIRGSAAGSRSREMRKLTASG